MYLTNSFILSTSFFQNTDYQPFPPTNRYWLYKIGADYSKSEANGWSFSARYGMYIYVYFS